MENRPQWTPDSEESTEEFHMRPYADYDYDDGSALRQENVRKTMDDLQSSASSVKRLRKLILVGTAILLTGIIFFTVFLLKRSSWELHIYNVRKELIASLQYYDNLKKMSPRKLDAGQPDVLLSLNAGIDAAEKASNIYNKDLESKFLLYATCNLAPKIMEEERRVYGIKVDPLLIEKYQNKKSRVQKKIERLDPTGGVRRRLLQKYKTLPGMKEGMLAVFEMSDMR